MSCNVIIILMFEHLVFVKCTCQDSYTAKPLPPKTLVTNLIVISITENLILCLSFSECSNPQKMIHDLTVGFIAGILADISVHAFEAYLNVKRKVIILVVW